MAASAAGQRPETSNTVRPAEKGAKAEKPDAALVRRTVNGIVDVTGCRRKEARQRVTAWLAGGAARSDLEAWLRDNYRVDPTGVTAVRNVSRAGGGAHV